MDGEIRPDELAALLGVDGGEESADGNGESADGNGESADGNGESADGDGEAADGDGEAADGDGESGIRIVDIRDQRAFDRGHIPHSECIPFPELTTRVAELEGAERIVTVCPHGVASRQAAQLIGSYAGTEHARVESLHGGIEAWERDIGDLEATPTDASGGGDANDDGPNANGSEGPDAPF